MTEAAPRLIDDVAELVKLVALEDVYFLEIAGRRTSEKEPAEVPVFFSSVQARQNDDGIEARFVLAVQSEELEAKIDVVARYTYDDAIEVGPEAQRGFLEKIALFAVWPYLREQVSAMCARLRIDVLNLGVIVQGQFTLSDVIKAD